MTVSVPPDDDLGALLSHYAPESETWSLDPETPLDQGISQIKWRGKDLSRARTELAHLLDNESDDGELHLRTVGYVPLPAGGSARSWLRYVAARLAGADLSPEIPSGDFGGLEPDSEGTMHRGRFPDEQTANRASTLVLRAHEAQVRAWAADPAGVPRLHVVAEVGSALGGPVGWVTDVDERGRPSGGQVETGTCVVLLTLAEPGRPVVLTSYPELPVDVRLRERYPTLPALFGAFFNQDVIARDRTRWAAERIFHRDTAPAVVARIADELGALLDDTAGDDAALQRALHALGSCTLAVDPRRWVRGLRRRITDLEWTS